MFYYGVFCSDYEGPEDAPGVDYSTPKDTWPAQREERKAWFENLKLSIMRGEIEKPEWMLEEEGNGEWSDTWAPSTCLYLEPRDEKYRDLADKICALLNSVSADGGYDG